MSQEGARGHPGSAGRQGAIRLVGGRPTRRGAPAWGRAATRGRPRARGQGAARVADGAASGSVRARSAWSLGAELNGRFCPELEAWILGFGARMASAASFRGRRCARRRERTP